MKEYFGEPRASWIEERQDLPVSKGRLPEVSVHPVVPENSGGAALGAGDDVSQGADPTASGGPANGRDSDESDDGDRSRVDASPTGRQLRRPDQRRRPVRYL